MGEEVITGVKISPHNEGGTMKCSICGHTVDLHRHPVTKKVYWSEGHNAEPVNDGRCCTVCNNTVVIPRRLADMEEVADDS